MAIVESKVAQAVTAATAPHRQAPVVAVRDLWMTYPGSRSDLDVHALEQIDVNVWPSEFVCFVGPSGCGKTTLLQIIGGFLKPTRGEVLVEGAPVAGPDPRRIFIFQEGGVFPWLSVAGNIAIGLSRRPDAERSGLLRHYVDLVGLTGFENSYPQHLSGGMRQRVEIARALAADPEIIYMDEPFGALDYFTRFKMRADLVRIWQQERKTILFVTHDIEEAIQLADRVVIMSRRPARIQAVVPVSLPRPRDLDAPAYLEIRQRLLDYLGFHPGAGEPRFPIENGVQPT